MALLGYLEHHADAVSGEVTLSRDKLGRELGLSRSRLLYATRSAVKDGLVRVRERRLPNGGSIENAYALSEEGKRVLERGRTVARSSAGPMSACRLQ